MTDPIADMLTRIRNANQALLKSVEVPHSRLKESIGHLLKREGYVAECSVTGDKKKTITLQLKYQGRKGVIAGLKRVSRPGLRRFVKATEIPQVLSGLGTAVVSTSQGVMTGAEARRQNFGGEVICFVW